MTRARYSKEAFGDKQMAARYAASAWRTPGRPGEDQPARPGVSTICVCAGVLVGLAFVVADTLVREGFRYISLATHFAAATGLYVVAGAVLGLLLSTMIRIESWCLGRLIRGRAKNWQLVRYGLYGVIAAVASIDTAKWTFSGERAQASLFRVWGPVGFCLALGVLASLGAFVFVQGVSRRFERQTRAVGFSFSRRRSPWAFSCVGSTSRNT